MVSGYFLLFLLDIQMENIYKNRGLILTTVWEMAVHLAVVGDVFDRSYLCCHFSHDMSLIRSGTELSQFLKIFLPIFRYVQFLDFYTSGILN